MVQIKIGYQNYDTDDIVGECKKCKGYLYNAPSLINNLKLTAEQSMMFISGLWIIAYCPECHEVSIIETGQ